MKRLIVFATVALVTVAMIAQEKSPRRGRDDARPKEGRQMMMHGIGPWAIQLLSSKETLEKIGVTDAELQQKILAALAPLNEKGDALERQVREISRDQFQQMRALFDDDAKDPKSVLGVIDEVAKLRAEQGKLIVKAVQVLREHLSKEQLAKIRALVFERGRDRGMVRRGGKEGGGEHRGRPPRGGRGGRRNAPQEP